MKAKNHDGPRNRGGRVKAILRFVGETVSETIATRWNRRIPFMAIEQNNLGDNRPYGGGQTEVLCTTRKQRSLETHRENERLHTTRQS